MDLRSTQIGIKEIKDYFERELGDALGLIRVSAPLFVKPSSGLNDNLTGNEKAVSFEMRRHGENLEIVQSLAKWKRFALKWYGFKMYEGIYTDMNAIRPDEILDRTHSIYVDQWDWEKIIAKEDRNEDYLRHIVNEIYQVFKKTEEHINKIFKGKLRNKLPDEIYFINSQELEDLYPSLDFEEREYEITKKHKAVFISKIGKELNSGLSHGLRSPDYDDWELNGDIIFWDEEINGPLELSSMGIRVDEDRLAKQLTEAGAEDRIKLEYHRSLLNGDLPYTIGGGIGQSRICMFFLEKEHIGQVQASAWTEEILKDCREKGIFIL